MKQPSADQLLKNQINLLMASVNWDPQQDTEEEEIALCAEFLKLPLEVRYGMINPQVEKSIAQMAKDYKIYDYKKIGELSRLIREVFTRGIREKEIVQRSKEKIGLGEVEVGHLVKEIQNLIALIKRLGKEELSKATTKMSIIPALKQYQDLGEQRISEAMIRLKIFNEPVAPTIKNWLEDYFSRLGTQKHNAMQRSDYLFKSDNGKKLSNIERNNLGIVLRSYDTDENLTIHTIKQEVIFSEGVDEKEEEKKPVPSSVSVKPTVKPPVTKPTPAKPQGKNLNEVASKNQKAVDYDPMDFNIGKNNLIYPMSSFTMIDPNKEVSRPKETPSPKKAEPEQKAAVPESPAAPDQATKIKVEEKPAPKRDAGKNVVDLSEYFK